MKRRVLSPVLYPLLCQRSRRALGHHGRKRVDGNAYGGGADSLFYPASTDTEALAVWAVVLNVTVTRPHQ
ncbi:MAG: hypothetical protein JF887_07880 [Candidatus Dormibacteraeota bacterium]|uniref:Uncharacterized protein n=1 Tax=Candidatus Amunia macphersoniae TaxID=3127014 RepID=A0A934N9R5_9BACT|nr:hypothetical protein [Candidatus Dormibacteraeota bacterium]